METEQKSRSLARYVFFAFDHQLEGGGESLSDVKLQPFSLMRFALVVRGSHCWSPRGCDVDHLA